MLIFSAGGPLDFNDEEAWALLAESLDVLFNGQANTDPEKRKVGFLLTTFELQSDTPRIKYLSTFTTTSALLHIARGQLGDFERWAMEERRGKR